MPQALRTPGHRTQPTHARTASTPTGQRLILAAEKLFARNGIDAVSLRAVMTEADTNVASVHYHFGSKDALIAAAIAHRSLEISTQRGHLLGALESDPHPTARQLAEAFIRPIADTASDDQGQAWVRFISGIITTGHPAIAIVAKGFALQGRRITAILRRICPHETPVTLRFRLAQAMTLTFQVLGNPANVQGILALSGTRLTPNEILEQLLDLTTAILTGPASQAAAE